MRAALIALSLLLIGPLASETRAADQGYGVYGAGGDSCQQWTEGRSLHDGGLPLTLPGFQQAVREAWVFGFIGKAQDDSYTYGGRVLGGQVGTDALLALVDSYCADNPSDAPLGVRDAAKAVFVVLRNRTPR